MPLINYDSSTLDKLVKYCRKPVKPVEVNGVEDVKLPPNNHLMSYVVSRDKLTRGQIVELLNDKDKINSVLEDCSCTLKSNNALPDLFGIDYSEPFAIVLASISMNGCKFVLRSGGYESIEENRYAEMLIADKKQKVHTYPSGQKVPYVALTNEMPANVSIFSMGYGDACLGEAYVRDNSITVLLALLDVVKDSKEFRQYSDLVDGFEENARGIIIAHELTELGMFNSGELDECELSTADAEQSVEEKARVFLQKQGVDMRNYVLFHQLRACEDKIKGKNKSAQVLDSINESLFFS